MNSARLNILFQAAHTVANLAYPLFTFAWISRVMGPEMVGRISFVASIAAWFTLLGSAAIPLYGSREIAKARTDPTRLIRTYSSLVAVNLLATAAATLLYAACVLFSGTLRVDWPLFVAAGFLVVANAANLEWAFQGLEEFRSVFLRNLAMKGLSIVLLVILVDDKEDAVIFLSLGSATMAAYNLWGLWHARGRLRFSAREWRLSAHLRPLSVLVGAAAASSAYVYLDGVLLGFLAGDLALGLFSTAVRISRISLAGIMAITLALLPRLSYLMESGRLEEHSALSQKSIHAVWYFCFPTFAILWGLAPVLVELLAGAEFRESVPTLRIALLLLPIAGLGNFLGLQVLFPAGKEKVLLHAALAGLATSLACNLALIPAFRQDGAAFAAVAAETASLGVLIWGCLRMRLTFRLADGRSLGYFALGMASGAAALAASSLFSRPVPAMCAGLAAGAATYLLPLAALGDPLTSKVAAALRSKLGAPSEPGSR